MLQEKQSINSVQEAELKKIACAEDVPLEERLRAVRQIHDSGILLSCVWGSNDIQVKHAAIARIDDVKALRMIQAYDAATREKIRQRAQYLYRKQGLIT